MVQLLVIADDFTGALDTAVQFVKKGIATKVSIDRDYHGYETEKASVVVIDAETRPLVEEDAYVTIKEIVTRAEKAGISAIYKKTDSALRGNIGAELTAVVDCGKSEKLFFIPAFPEVHRITKGGIQYIDGVPVEQSPFGKDPFEPVKQSNISQLIQQQSSCLAKRYTLQEAAFIPRGKEIVIFDAETEQDMKSIAAYLQQKRPCYLAGCAGMAAYLPEIFSLEGTVRKLPLQKEGVLVACGSVNPITKAQIGLAVSQGFERIHMTPEQSIAPFLGKEIGLLPVLEKLQKKCNEKKNVILDTMDIENVENMMIYAEKKGISAEKIRKIVPKSIGLLIKALLEQGLEYTIVLTGGDTLLGVLKLLGCTEVCPICEIAQGTVVSFVQWQGKTVQIVSKSGGFGEKEVFTMIRNQLVKEVYDCEVCNDTSCL